MLQAQAVGYVVPMSEHGTATEAFIDLYARSFGEQVKRVRVAAGMTQQQVAESATQIGAPLSRVMVAKIETNRRPATVQELLALSAAMHVPLTHLLPGAMDKGELAVRREGLKDLSMLAETTEMHLDGVLASLEDLRATFSMEARRARERLTALSDESSVDGMSVADAKVA